MLRTVDYLKLVRKLTDYFNGRKWILTTDYKRNMFLITCIMVSEQLENMESEIIC